MKSSRHRSREAVLQALYQWQYTEHSFDELNAQYSAGEDFAKLDANLFRTLLAGALDAKEELVEALQPHLDRPWAEVSPIERGVVLLGAFELMKMPETPYRVIINEAIELAKSFGGTDGHKYVNGVLDKLAAISRADEISHHAANPSTRKPPAKAAVTVTKKPTRKPGSKAEPPSE